MKYLDPQLQDPILRLLDSTCILHVQIHLQPNSIIKILIFFFISFIDHIVHRPKKLVEKEKLKKKRVQTSLDRGVAVLRGTSCSTGKLDPTLG